MIGITPLYADRRGNIRLPTLFDNTEMARTLYPIIQADTFGNASLVVPGNVCPKLAGCDLAEEFYETLCSGDYELCAVHGSQFEPLTGADIINLQERRSAPSTIKVEFGHLVA